ncbi:Uncharacterised protein [Vibrio cholerae]|nr:Uncharacterised protein [Vibrio cholerae]
MLAINRTKEEIIKHGISHTIPSRIECIAETRY